MLTKTILAATTAALIAAGSLGASTTAADAHQASGHYVIKLVEVPVTTCKPIFKKVSWYSYYGWQTKLVKVDEKCYTSYVVKQQQVWVPYPQFKYKNYSFKYNNNYSNNYNPSYAY
jgi:hypothetical protein